MSKYTVRQYLSQKMASLYKPAAFVVALAAVFAMFQVARALDFLPPMADSGQVVGQVLAATSYPVITLNSTAATFNPITVTPLSFDGTNWTYQLSWNRVRNAQGAVYVTLKSNKAVMISSTDPAAQNGSATFTVAPSTAYRVEFWQAPNAGGVLLLRKFFTTLAPTTATTNTGSTGSVRVGSVINSNGTIYLVAQNGLYGFPTMAIFTGWGFSVGQLVTANSAELALSQIGLVPTKLASCATPLAQIANTCGTTTSAAAAAAAAAATAALGTNSTSFTSSGSSTNGSCPPGTFKSPVEGDCLSGTAPLVLNDNGHAYILAADGTHYINDPAYSGSTNCQQYLSIAGYSGSSLIQFPYSNELFIDRAVKLGSCTPQQKAAMIAYANQCESITQAPGTPGGIGGAYGGNPNLISISSQNMSSIPAVPVDLVGVSSSNVVLPNISASWGFDTSSSLPINIDWTSMPLAKTATFYFMRAGTTGVCGTGLCPPAMIQSIGSGSASGGHLQIPVPHPGGADDVGGTNPTTGLKNAAATYFVRAVTDNGLIFDSPWFNLINPSQTCGAHTTWITNASFGGGGVCVPDSPGSGGLQGQFGFDAGLSGAGIDFTQTSVTTPGVVTPNLKLLQPSMGVTMDPNLDPNQNPAAYQAQEAYLVNGIGVLTGTNPSQITLAFNVPISTAKTVKAKLVQLNDLCTGATNAYPQGQCPTNRNWTSQPVNGNAGNTSYDLGTVQLLPNCNGYAGTYCKGLLTFTMPTVPTHFYYYIDIISDDVANAVPAGSYPAGHLNAEFPYFIKQQSTYNSANGGSSGYSRGNLYVLTGPTDTVPGPTSTNCGDYMLCIPSPCVVTNATPNWQSFGFLGINLRGDTLQVSGQDPKNTSQGVRVDPNCQSHILSIGGGDSGVNADKTDSGHQLHHYTITYKAPAAVTKLYMEVCIQDAPGLNPVPDYSCAPLMPDTPSKDASGNVIASHDTPLFDNTSNGTSGTMGFSFNLSTIQGSINGSQYAGNVFSDLVFFQLFDTQHQYISNITGNPNAALANNNEMLANTTATCGQLYPMPWLDAFLSTNTSGNKCPSGTAGIGGVTGGGTVAPASSLVSSATLSNGSSAALTGAANVTVGSPYNITITGTSGQNVFVSALFLPQQGYPPSSIVYPAPTQVGTITSNTTGNTFTSQGAFPPVTVPTHVLEKWYTGTGSILSNYYETTGGSLDFIINPPSVSTGGGTTGTLAVKVCNDTAGNGNCTGDVYYNNSTVPLPGSTTLSYSGGSTGSLTLNHTRASGDPDAIATVPGGTTYTVALGNLPSGYQITGYQTIYVTGTNPVTIPSVAVPTNGYGVLVIALKSPGSGGGTGANTLTYTKVDPSNDVTNQVYSTTPSGTSVPSGTNVTVTAFAGNSSKFTGWSLLSCGTNLTCTFPMPNSAVTLTGTFAPLSSGGGTPTLSFTKTSQSPKANVDSYTIELSSLTSGHTYVLTVNNNGYIATIPVTIGSDGTWYYISPSGVLFSAGNYNETFSLTDNGSPVTMVGNNSPYVYTVTP